MPKPDIAAQLDHLAATGDRPGCTVWLCMVTGDLRRAANEIRKLREELTEERTKGLRDPNGLFGHD